YVGSKPVVLGEIVVAPASPSGQRAIELVFRAAQSAHDRGRKRLRLPKCVADTPARRRVLEVARISGEHPARTGGLPEVPLPTNGAQDLADPLAAADSLGDRLAAQDVLHEAALEVVPKPAQLSQLRH